MMPWVWWWRYEEEIEWMMEGDEEVAKQVEEEKVVDVHVHVLP